MINKYNVAVPVPPAATEMEFQRPSARDGYTPANIGDMPSKSSSVVPLRLPNEALEALNDIVANTDGMSRSEWLRRVVMPAIEAETNSRAAGQEVSAA